MRIFIILLVFFVISESICYGTESKEDYNTGVWVSPSLQISGILNEFAVNSGFRLGLTFNRDFSVYGEMHALLNRNIKGGFKDPVLEESPAIVFMQVCAGFENIMFHFGELHFILGSSIGTARASYALESEFIAEGKIYTPAFSDKWFLNVNPDAKIGWQVTPWFKATVGFGYRLVFGDDFTQNDNKVSATDFSGVSGILQLSFGSFW